MLVWNHIYLQIRLGRDSGILVSLKKKNQVALEYEFLENRYHLNLSESNASNPAKKDLTSDGNSK